MLTSLAIGYGGLGRFGNNCFTAASVIGIAIKSGQPFAFPHWKTFDNANFGQPVDDMEEYFVNPLPRIPEGLTFEQYPYFWEYRDINLPTGNWDLFAHLQSIKYFRHCMNTIRHYFTMKDEPEQNEYVAIHYRAGDYIKGEDSYHPRCSSEYYAWALLYLQNFGKFKAIVFSDDIEDAKKVIGEADNITYTNTGSYLMDFAHMKKCKHFITANSSYSHFAALLGEHPDKKIIMPRKWFGAAADGLNFDSLYPEEAIVI